MRKHVLLATLLVFALSNFTYAQLSKKELKKKRHEAHTYFAAEEYEDSKNLYISLKKIDPDNSAEYDYYIGVSILRSIHDEKALPFLLSAKKNGHVTSEKPTIIFDPDRNKYVSDDLDYCLGRAYHLNHEFKKAITSYHVVKDKIIHIHHGHGHELEKRIMDKLIRECQYGIRMRANPRDSITIKNLGPEINSEYEEITPMLSADEKTIIFTSRRPTNTGKVMDVDGKYTEDIYISHKNGETWGKPELISPAINSPEHDAAVALSPNGQQLIIYRNNNHMTGDLYQSELNGSSWSTPKKFKNGINTKHLENSATISTDHNYMFFTSNRPGGLGGEDIYMCSWENDHWSDPVNMGPDVNTEYDDDAPFLHVDEKTLYFSSKGHNSMGGYDIFQCNFNKTRKKCTGRKNLGWPINSAEDDIFFVWSPDGKRAYYSSHHEDSYGDKDIYVMTVPDAHVPVILLYGYVKSKVNGTPVHAEIEITNLSIGEKVSTIQSNSHTGRYTIILNPGAEYGIHVESAHFLPATKNINLPDINQYYEEEVDFELESLNKGSITTLNNVFFENNRAHLDKKSFSELNKFVKKLKDNPDLFVEIAGHTEIGGRADLNKKLSQHRSEAVMHYFIKQGIEAARIHAVGYGSDFPITTGKSEHDRQKNRRVEMIIHNKKEEGDTWEPYYSDKVK